MPARTIPKNYRNVTGVAASSKSIGEAAFESTLERDFITILDFDFSVTEFEVQPVKIEFQDATCNLRYYTPDLLVKQNNRCILYEVKHRKDLKKDWQILKPKYKAAIAYAKSKGWKFKIITEIEIRTTYLDNVKFLKRYSSPIDDPRMSTALDLMNQLCESTPEILTSVLANDFSNRAESIYLVWQLIARGYIQTDLTRPLTMETRIWTV